MSNAANSTPHTRPNNWTRRYASRLFYSDLIVVTIVLSSYAIIFLTEVTQPLDWGDRPNVPYWIVLTLLGIAWLVGLDAIDTRDEHTVGHGITEYRRIFNATLVVFGLVVVVAFFARIDLARSLFLYALPLGIVALIGSRWVWRQWLRRRQRAGAYVHRTVVIGDWVKVEHVTRTIRHTEGTGLLIVGVVTDAPIGSRTSVGTPVLGHYRDAEKVVDGVLADTVIFAGSDVYDPDGLRRLGWAMADRDMSLVVAPALTDVAGPRIHARPVAGLPLVHVAFPRLDGGKRFMKRTFDILGSLLLIIVFSPVMLGVAIAVKADSRGPLFYRQERVGRRGKPFGMIKFRSMIADADDQLASLLDLQGTTDRPLFKVVDDPRITKVGRVLRKHSLDELPQLLNVLAGQMSLVGPRPHRLAEVELYDDAAHRRLFVKPGMSGLWQVSGRSSLAWEDALRLDLYYVENWSFTQDMLILVRTIRAVIAPGHTAH